MSSAPQGLDQLVDQTQNSLSISESSQDASPTFSGSSPLTSNSISSPSSPLQANVAFPPTLRQTQSVGGGSGGPPPRLNNAGTGGPGANSYRGGGPSNGPGSMNIGTGGPGSRTRANEMTRQLASTRLPPSLQARLAANANRGSSGANVPSEPTGSAPYRVGHDDRLDAAAFLNMPNGASPLLTSPNSTGSYRAPQGLRPAPGLPPGARQPQAVPVGGLAGRRAKGPGMKLSDLSAGGQEEGGMQSGPSISGNNANVPPTKRRLAPPGRLAEAGGGLMSTAFDMHKNIVDPSGRLNFDGKAVLSASGVEFRNGTSFNINMDDLDLLDELGKGAYGTVRKVRHTKTRVDMAMKEIRLELDDNKLNAIIMELDILHRATSSNIVEFYGAFFYESCVYYCMEFMDAGSLENLYYGSCSVPEDILARITTGAVLGLRFLKDELQIMHRDVKPTNITMNRKGEVKLCDFGVSGQLEKSLAKTNIGCQSYMAPERIKGESQNLVGTYTVASDVWSLGLTIVETTMGTYPYPPETYSNVFAQLQAIVHGDPPQLPATYSAVARDFVAGCLEKIPRERSTYKQMLEHPWLVQDREKGKDGVDMAGWVEKALLQRAERKRENSEAKVE
ncbi:hypothetical protein CBS101457_001897 [Exobasidium rhododendri]|nr:hypothetical protein CBS101457_001897 [Exobasidium rhododendri]